MVGKNTIEDLLVDALEPLFLSQETKQSQLRPIWISDFHVKTALSCPRKYGHEVQNPTRFQPDVFTVHKSLARYAARRPADTSRELVKAEMVDLRERSHQGAELGARKWIAEYAFDDCDDNGRALLASHSAGWLARVRDVMGSPEISGWSGHAKVSWEHPGKPLTLQAICDFITDEGSLVHIGSTTEIGRDIAAYVFMLHELAAPESSTGRKVVDLRRGVIDLMADDEMLKRGIDAAVTAISTHLDAKKDLPLRANPSFWSCRECPALESCSAGQAWQDHEPETRFGVRVRRAHS